MFSYHFSLSQKKKKKKIKKKKRRRPIQNLFPNQRYFYFVAALQTQT